MCVTSYISPSYGFTRCHGSILHYQQIYIPHKQIYIPHKQHKNFQTQCLEYRVEANILKQDRIRSTSEESLRVFFKIKSLSKNMGDEEKTTAKETTNRQTKT